MPMRCRLALICALSAAARWAVADPTQGLDLFTRGWPRAFFFRAAEGMAANPQVTYDVWDRNFSRLCGIEGKALDEEVPGRSRRNVEFFTRFKTQHPRQLVLLHYNGNARDPRDAGPGYFAGHWVYHTGCLIMQDLPAEEGESDLHVENVDLFRTEMGRYQDRNEDIGLCVLDDEGRPHWSGAEQVELLGKDPERKVLRVRRGCFGTTPRAFPAGRAYAAAHATEGPWGKNSNLMWFYNFSPRCPKSPEGRTCVDVLVGELARELGPGGRLETFDGLEFDVLAHQRWSGEPPASRGVDTDGDGRHDGGFHEGVNLYGVGVYDFCRRLRERVGDDRFLLADGHGTNSQRAFGQLNGIESEGWPTLSDWEFKDWSGGLNRHLYWDAFGRKPVFSYFNHKYIDGQEGRLPQIPFSRHRLALAAAQFCNAAVCYSFAPPREEGGLFPVWDELWKGEEEEVGWLGEPLGPPRRLAMEAPDVLQGAGRAFPADFVSRFVGEDVRVSRDGSALRVEGTDSARGELSLRLTDMPCSGPDLFVALKIRAAARAGYPADMPRLVWVGAGRSRLDLMSESSPPRAGMGLRGEGEVALDPTTGAGVRYFAQRKLGDETREAYLCHPPWRGGKTGYTFWERDVTVPPQGVLLFSIGMGELSPERSDGVVFRVLVRPEGGDWEQVYERTYNEARWQDEEVSLAPWEGRRVTLKFVTDCGPRDDSTTDHSSWGDVRVAQAGVPERRTAPVRYMTFAGPTQFEATFAFREIATPGVDLSLSIEGTEPVWITEVSAHAAPDAVLREFEHGVVLANPSLHPVTFSLADLLPGRQFRRIRGSRAQDPQTNDGRPAGGSVTVGERDGLFLAASD